jgi:hypothetical protein
VSKWLGTGWWHTSLRDLGTVWDLSISWQWHDWWHTSHRWWWRGKELGADEVISGQLAVFAAQTWHANASEVLSVIDGPGWDAGTSSQAWRVQAAVWQEAVGIDGWIAALGAENVTQLAVWWGCCANPIVVVVVVVADVVAIVVVVVVLSPAVANTASDLFSWTKDLSLFTVSSQNNSDTDQNKC